MNLFQGHTSWAYIASEYPVFESGLKRCRNIVPAMFDGPVGDTPVGIHGVRAIDGVRGAGIDAPRARAAKIFRRAIVGQWSVYDEFPNEEIRSERRVDEIGVLPYPTQSTALCPGFFEHRRRIDESAALNASRFPAEPFEKRIQIFLHDTVIIFPPGIPADFTGGFAGGRIHRMVVIMKYGNNAARSIYQPARIDAVFRNDSSSIPYRHGVPREAISPAAPIPHPVVRPLQYHRHQTPDRGRVP